MELGRDECLIRIFFQANPPCKASTREMVEIEHDTRAGFHANLFKDP
jgi:hypothetical protein